MKPTAATLISADKHQSPLIGPQARSTISYTPFGLKLCETEVSFGFNGQRTEASIGAYILGNGYRVYSPSLMRFYGPDSVSPFGRGGLNAYAYVSGDPINVIDPSGHVGKRLGRGARITVHLEKLNLGYDVPPFAKRTRRSWSVPRSMGLNERTSPTAPIGRRPAVELKGMEADARLAIDREVQKLSGILGRDPTLFHKALGAYGKMPRQSRPRVDDAFVLPQDDGVFLVYQHLEDLHDIKGSLTASLIRMAQRPRSEVQRRSAQEIVGNIVRGEVPQLGGAIGYGLTSPSTFNEIRRLADALYKLRILV